MEARKVLYAAIIALLLWSGIPLPADAGAKGPLLQLKETIDLVKQKLEVAGKSQHEDILRSLLIPRIDFEEMAKLSLGESWVEISQDEQKFFVRLFKELVEKSYLRRVEGIREVEMLFKSEKISGNHAEVLAEIRNYSIELNFFLKRSRGDWRVYDVEIGGIRFVKNYENQFRKVMRDAEFDGLLKRMEKKLSPKVED